MEDKWKTNSNFCVRLLNADTYLHLSMGHYNVPTSDMMGDNCPSVNTRSKAELARELAEKPHIHPLESRTFITSECPLRAASINAVQPSSPLTFSRNPACRSMLDTRAPSPRAAPSRNRTRICSFGLVATLVIVPTQLSYPVYGAQLSLLCHFSKFYEAVMSHFRITTNHRSVK